MKKTTVCILVTIFFVLPAFGQKGKAYEKDFYDGNYHLLYGQAENSLPYFTKLASDFPGNANLNYKAGLSHLKIPGSGKLAIPYLEKAALKTSKKYRPASHRERNAPIEAILYLGRAYRKDNHLNKAIETLKTYQESFTAESSQHTEAARQISMCENALAMMQEPVMEIPSPIPVVNIGNNNYNPCLSGDGRVLVFMSKRDYYTGIFMSRKTNRGWTTPSNITAQIESDGSYECVSLSHGGNTLILSHGEQNQKDLYFSKFDAGRWTRAQPLPGEVNSRWNEPYAFLSPDGKEIVFSSNRPGGFGGHDLYRAVTDTTGSWVSPVNLGKTVNTPFDELAPLYAPGRILYFSSDGHSTMGGLDVFMTQYEGQDWSIPSNPGYPVNTTDDDYLFVPTRDEAYGILARFQEPGNRSLLWFLSPEEILPEKPLTTVFVNLQGLQEAQAEDLRLFIVGGDGQDTLMAEPGPSGRVSFNISPGRYHISARGSGIRPVDKTLEVNEDDTALEIIVGIERMPVDPLWIMPVFFGFDKHTLDSGSEKILDQLVLLLKEYPELRLVIQGHTDAIGPDEYNQRLSERRALTVRKYLVEQDLSPDRFETKGFGKNKPVAVNRKPDGKDSPEGRKLNRRVDFALLPSPYPFIRYKEPDIPPGLKKQG